MEKGWNRIMEIADAIAEYDKARIASEAEFRQQSLGHSGQNLNAIVNGFSKDPLAPSPEPPPPTSSIIASYSGLKIALAGRSHSGKTTVANELKSLGVVSEVLSFSSGLKAGLAGFGIERSHPRYRYLCQIIGTDVMRGEDSYHWVKQMQAHLEGILSFKTSPRGYVIDDVRFANEMSWCLLHGFSVFYLQASNDELERRGSSLVSSEHDSEQVTPIKGVRTIFTNGNSPRATAASIIYTSLMNQDDGVV